jgi:DNA-binding transcriptional LysR family regulator
VQINQLIYFMALCEERNFTRAAKRCRISQPSLTNAIKALEDELGDALFTRKPKLELSTFGLAMKPHFKRVVLAFNRALVVANGHRDGRLPSRACNKQFGVEFIDGPGLHLRQRSKPRSATPTASKGASRQLPTT